MLQAFYKLTISSGIKRLQKTELLKVILTLGFKNFTELFKIPTRTDLKGNFAMYLREVR